MAGTVIYATLQRGKEGTTQFPASIPEDRMDAHVIVANTTERDAIEEFRRKARMTCYSIADNTSYRLGTDVTIPGQVWTDEGTGASFQLVSEKGQASGYAPINAEGFIDPIYIRSVYVHDSYTAADEAARFALEARTGDICHQLDTGQVFVKLNNNAAPTVAGDWADITSATGVSSVNGETGAVSVTINKLLTWGDNLNEFNAAVGNTPAVSNNASQIANNTSNITALYALIAGIQDDPNVDIPLYSASLQYDIGNTVLYDAGSGRLDLFRCKVAPVGVGTAPDNDVYWDLVGDFYTRQEMDDMLGLKADLVNGKVPLAQLPSEQLTMSYIADTLAARNALTPFTGMRVIVLDATGDARILDGVTTEYVYKLGDPKADTEGFVWLGEDTDQVFDFERQITRIPELGDTPGGATVNEGIENLFFGPVVPAIQANALPLAEVGKSVQSSIMGTVSKQDADTIDRIDYVRVSDETILQSDVPASPQLDTQNLNFDTPALTTILGVTETYRVDVLWTKDAVQKTAKGNDLIHEGIYPMLFGNTTTGLADLYTLTQLLQKEGNAYVGVTGTERTYFAFPELYADLVDIVDQHQDSQEGAHFSLTPAVVSVSSNGLAADWTTNYKVYESSYDALWNDERYGYLFDYESELSGEGTMESLNNAKLDSIEWNAEVNQTDSQVKFQYESNNDTNAYSDADKNKLAGVEALAEVNQADAEIKTQYENNADTNEYSDAEKSKLAGIDPAAIGDMKSSEFSETIHPDSMPAVDRAFELIATGFNTTGTDIPKGRYLVVQDVVLAAGYATVRLADNTLNDHVDAVADQIIPAGGTARLGIVAYNTQIDTTGQQQGAPVYLGQNGTVVFSPPTTGSLVQVGTIHHVGNPGFIASLEYINRLTQSFQADWRANTFYPKGTTIAITAPLAPSLGIFLMRAVQDHTSASVLTLPDPNLEIVGGDMKTIMYDPNSVYDDAFNMSNMIDNLNHVRMTKAEQTKLAGLEDPTFKGYLLSPNVLNAEYPVGEVGWSAIVIFENDESTPNGNLWNWVGTPTDAWEDSGISGIGGDMAKAVYDPTNVLGDAFDLDNMVEGADVDKLFFTQTEQTKLAGLEEGTNYYDQGEIDTALGLKADKTYVDQQDLLKMDKSVYDPTTVEGDAFDMDNMAEGTNLILSAVERSNIAANTAAQHGHANKALLDTLIDSGGGEAYLGDDGLYKDAAKAGIHNGTCIEQQDITIVESGGLVYADVEKVGGGDLRVYFGSSSYLLDCTTGAGAGGTARVQLIAGSPTVPTRNFIYTYLNVGVPTLAVVTTYAALPSEFAWVALVVIRDAANVSVEGSLVLQRMTDAATHDNRGRLSHLGERIRVGGAQWTLGVDPSCSITPQPSALDDVGFSVLLGNVYQLHRQDFPALNIGTDSIYLTGVSGTGVLQEFSKHVNLNAINEYADGSAIQDGDYFNLVIWGSVNKDSANCKIFVNPGSAGYSTANAAYNDRDKLANMSVHEDFRTTGFLIARIPLLYTAADNGTLVFINPIGSPQFIDLRGRTLDVSSETGHGESSSNTAEEIIYDNTSSGLAAVNVQEMGDELASKHIKLRGGLYYDSGGVPVVETAGEVAQTTSLFASIENVDSPAPGRLRALVAGDVIVNASLSAEMVSNTTTATFQVAVNGTIVPGAICTIGRGNTQGVVVTGSVSAPLTLAINDYVSVFMAGSAVNLYNQTLTIKGEA